MIKLYICCLVFIIGSVEVGPDIDMKFHQEVMEIVIYDSIFIRCTCDIYNLIQRAAHQESHILPGEDVALDENLTCMHCRFFREHLLDAYTTATTQATTQFTRPLFMVHKSLQHMNSPIQQVGNVIPGGTTRFSAKGKEGLSIVHISFYQGNVQILCTDGHCSINFKIMKNITR